MESLFDLTVSPWELIARGTAVYWFLFGIFRFVMHRDVGSLAIADVLLLVLIADAAQNAMSGGYESLADGAILVSTIVAWNYALDWASYRSEFIRRLAEPAPLLLISKGRVLKHNLRKELLTVDDLKSKLRAHGVDDVSTVKSAYMEGDGEVTVIQYPKDAAKNQDNSASQKKAPL
jgi:uncharacterized membrane protein YcaP (DUF421 family)